MDSSTTFKTELEDLVSYLKGEDTPHVYRSVKSDLEPALRMIYEEYDEYRLEFGIMTDQTSNDPCGVNYWSRR